ncbi:MAG: gamma-glutamyltransferase [Rhizobiales bacterium]|nr:gamma-glutamyltransferase [Hyphomicrobiales bacterium]
MVSLHSTGHKRGVVCAPHAKAVADGQEVLRAGGNALEAMIAMAASIAVVYPHMNHIGGDGFWLVREPDGNVVALMGAGPAGSKASIDFYRSRGLNSIPARGPLAALTVPAAISAWMLALELSKKHGGKISLSSLLSPAVKHARDGYVVSKSQHSLTRDKLPEMTEAKGFHDTFLVNGEIPDVGMQLKQTALANTLERLGQAGLQDFYTGEIAREIAADLENIGSPVTLDDLLKQTALHTKPLRTELRCGTLYNSPPPTQGLASLILLGLFDRLDVKEPETFEFIHAHVEATKRAFLVRDRIVCDPARITADINSFLSSSFLDRDVLNIQADRAAPWPQPAAKGDTIWMGAADASGLVVSYIQSIYWEFGSGCVLPRTGILMQNRGASFSLDESALNSLAPGRLPFHTLNPALAALNDGRTIAFGTMGGEGQPQTQAAIFSRHVLFGQSLGAAIAAPRWLLGRTWGSVHTNLRCEARFDPAVIQRMASAGHDIEVIADDYSDTMGHAGAVVLHGNKTLEGAHDPRADGGAAGC